MKPKIGSDVKLSVVADVLWQKGDGQKSPWTKPFRQNAQDKTRRAKTLANQDKPPAKTYLCMQVLLKLGRSEMCDVL